MKISVAEAMQKLIKKGMPPKMLLDLFKNIKNLEIPKVVDSEKQSVPKEKEKEDGIL